jgi:hypothetical protein
MKMLWIYSRAQLIGASLAVLLACTVPALSLTACATTGAPSQNQAVIDLAIKSATLIAVDRVVTRDHATPADIEARAGRIVLVASSLKALGTDALSTLPLIKAALAPQLDKLNLSPLERAQADLLVQTLVAVALERTDVSKYEARVDAVLTAVIDAASVYLPAATPAPTP